MVRFSRVTLSLLLVLAMVLTCAPGLAEDAKIADGDITLVVMRGEHANQPLLKESPALTGIYERTGVKIDLQPIASADYANKKSVLLASNNMPDIMFVDLTDIKTYGRTGMFEPLTPYLEQGELPNYQLYVDSDPNFKSLMLDGVLYGFTQCFKLGTEALNGYGPCVRIDLLEANGIAEPATWDELYDVLLQLKQIYPDSAPFTSRNGTVNTVKTISYSFGTGETIYFDEEADGGRYVYGPITDTFKSLLAYLNKMYANGVLDPDYATNSSQTWQENITSGKSFFYYDNSGFSTSMTLTLQATDPSYEMQLIKIPENSQGVRRNRFYSKNWYDQNYAVSADLDAAHKQAALKLMDWLYSDEGSTLTNWGIEGETYERTENGPVYLEELTGKYANDAYPYYSLWSYIGATLLSFSPVHDGNATRQTQPQSTWLYDFCAQDGAYRQAVLDPPFTEQETERVNEILAALNNIRDLSLDKFIMGDRSLDTFDDFRNELIAAGAEELETIYNGARARIAE